MPEHHRPRGSRSAASRMKNRCLYSRAGIRFGRNVGLLAAILLLPLCSLMACANLTGWEIPGTEKSAIPTTTVYLVLENVETVPEEIMPQGEIFVDDAFFGHTNRPAFSKFVGNALVVGKIHTEKRKVHTIKVLYPGYEPFEHTRYFGTLPEYSISFRLKWLDGQPVMPAPPEPEAEEGRKWYQFWRWFGSEGDNSDVAE